MGVEVCPVHKAEYKSSHFSSIHVGTMSYQPEPRGLKRKRLDDEEDLPRPVRHPPHFLQEMYEITNDKIKKVQAEKSPPLLRLVLMNNIIRRLRDNFEKDGIYVSGLTRAATTPVWCNVSNQVSDLDPPPSSSTDVFSYFNYPLSGNGTDRPPTPIPMSSGDYSSLSYTCEQYRSLMDIDDSLRVVVTPSVRSGYERGGESGALWTEDHDRLSSLNWSSVLKSTNFDLSNCSSDCSISDETGSNTSLHTLMPAVTSIETYLCSSGVYSASSASSPNSNSLSGNTSPVSGSSPTSSEDEIFGDVDLTLYDYDYTPLSPPNVAMAPLSAEELMWSLSNDTRPTNSDDREYTSVRT